MKEASPPLQLRVKPKLGKEPRLYVAEKQEWLSFLARMLVDRNPLQGDVLRPDAVYGPCKSNVFLKHLLSEPYLEIGDFTYAHTEYLEGEKLLKSLVPYSFGDQKLKIGKFCSIAMGVQFISPYANHQTHSFTTYPFWHIFSRPECLKPWVDEAQAKGDTLVGHDVWLGREAMILPGVKIGNGAVIAARAIVTKEVPPYTIVGGNPAQVLKYRFTADVIEELQRIQWWHWDLNKIRQYYLVLMGNDLKQLQALF